MSTPDNPADVDRWEQRYAEPLKFDVFITEEVIKIGDEIFSISDLKKAHENHPQPTSHPFKPHHYCQLKDLQEIRESHERHRKMGR